MMPSRDDRWNGISKGPPFLLSSRFLLAVLACWGYGNFFFQRINLSMSIVCMVNHTAVDADHVAHLQNSTGHTSTTDNLAQTPSSSSPQFGNSPTLSSVDVDKRGNSSTTGDCSSQSASDSEKEDGELIWSKSTQGFVLGSIYLGYTLSMMPSQRIVQRFGSKRTALVTVLVMSVITMVLPTAARASPWLFLVLRVIQGMVSGVGIASVYAICGAWAPPQERNTLVSIVFSGGMVASSVVYVTSGLLCRFGFAGGWPSVFYVFGIVGFVWCILWQLLVFDSPHLHPRIDPREAIYITASIGNKPENKGAVPWIKIFQSPAVWAVVIANVGFNWPFFMLLAVLPQYMKEVLGFDITSNGVYSTLPYISLFVITNFWANVCDGLQNRRLASVTFVRKISTAIGCVIPSVLYVVLSFLGCTQAVTVVILMSLAIGISGTNYQGFLPNPYDIAPKFATAIICLSNTAGGSLALVSPYIVAALTEDKTREQWQRVFFLTSAIIVLCCILYLIFGKTTQLDWTKDLDSTLGHTVNKHIDAGFVDIDGNSSCLYGKATGSLFTGSSSHHVKVFGGHINIVADTPGSTLEVPTDKDDLLKCSGEVDSCQYLTNQVYETKFGNKFDERAISFDHQYVNTEATPTDVQSSSSGNVDKQQKVATDAALTDINTSSSEPPGSSDSGISDGSECTRM